jgi:hypothetical protein
MRAAGTRDADADALGAPMWFEHGPARECRVARVWRARNHDRPRAREASELKSV